MNRTIRGTAAAVLALATLSLPNLASARAPLAAAAQAAPTAFTEGFGGAPATPQPWKPSNWDVTVHSRDVGTWQRLDTAHASHGPDCAAPPAVHDVTSYDDAVFLCKDHVMTSMNAEGYGLIYLTPNAMADFSGGEATVTFDVSTRKTSTRDWWDIWITPYEDNLQLAGESWYPDLQGPPRNAVHIKMADFNNGQTGFIAEVFRDFRNTSVRGDTTTSYERFLVPDAARRDTFQLRISRGHLTFGMPGYGRNWIDTDIPDLGWDKGVVQLGHHSYNPEKDDKVANADGNTWHWDNVSIEPAQPFTIIRADRRVADPAVSFPAPAPADAHLRFAGIGNDMQVSFDGGPWTAAVKQVQSMNLGDHFTSYWTPVPEGTTSVAFSARSSCCGLPWQVRDVSIFSTAGNGGPPPPPTTTTTTRPPTTTTTTAPPPPTTTTTTTTRPPTTTTTAPPPPPTTTTTTAPGSGGHFATRPVGAGLPSDRYCSYRVERTGEEIRPGNAQYNATPGRATEADDGYPYFSRVTGNFTGTTEEIIRWAACKWGIDEDVVRAQVARESWWNQTAAGDYTTNQALCYPGAPLRSGRCAESIGLMQVRTQYFRSTVETARDSSAYNLDVALAVWRTCFEGGEPWLNSVDRGEQYRAGDLWGCVGRWYSGRWHTPAAESYIGSVQQYLDQRIWETPEFANG